MLKVLIIKEFKNILQSPKFIAIFVTSAVLILLSIFIGIQEYQTNLDQYNTGISETDQELRERTLLEAELRRTLRKEIEQELLEKCGKNNYFGIGAKVEVKSGELYQSHVVSDPITHFGLGQRNGRARTQIPLRPKSAGGGAGQRGDGARQHPRFHPGIGCHLLKFKSYI